MLRKLAAASGAVLIAVTLAAAPALASAPELLVANRGHGSPPTTGVTLPPDTPLSPPPTTPESPPPDVPSLPPGDSGPPPGDSGPPPSAFPPAPPPPEVRTEPPPPAPTPTTAPPEKVAPVVPPRSPAGSPDEAPKQLPQTGTGTRPLTTVGGTTLLGAGLAVFAGARRRSRQASVGRTVDVRDRRAAPGPKHDEVALFIAGIVFPMDGPGRDINEVARPGVDGLAAT